MAGRAGAQTGGIWGLKAGLIASLLGLGGLGAMLASPERLLAWSFESSAAQHRITWSRPAGQLALDTVERPAIGAGLELAREDGRRGEPVPARLVLPVDRLLAVGDHLTIASPSGAAIFLEVTEVKPIAAGTVGIGGKLVAGPMLLIVARDVDRPDAGPLRFLMDVPTQPPQPAPTKL